MDNKEQCRAEFEAWKGYPLPPFNSDGQFELDWLHREFVAFVAGLNRRAPAPQAALPTEGVPFPPLEFPVMTHNKLGPLWDRLGMQLYALKYSDLVRVATSPATAVVLSDSQIDDMAFGYCPSGKIGELRKFAKAILSASGVKNA